ncbi:MAG: transposase [Gammaproteobacteria bacterium]|nr:transposase [Gammaproteobacteria bacterium]
MGYAALQAGRVSIARQVYLVTIVTHQRQPWFADFFAARTVINELRRLNDTHMAESMAWVIMPEHIHWLMALGTTRSLSIAVKMLKGRSARALGLAALGGAVWQRSFHDHAVRREAELRLIARYIVMNPLRRGLVRRIGDYPHWDAIWL